MNVVQFAGSQKDMENRDFVYYMPISCISSNSTDIFPLFHVPIAVPITLAVHTGCILHYK